MSEKSPIPGHLDRYAGKKPPRAGFNIVVLPEVFLLVGHIALQWAALGETIKFHISFLRFQSPVPEDLSNARVRTESKHQIEYLRKLGRHVYHDTRDNAVAEFEGIISDINRLKGHRDKLMHGTFSQQDNKDPNSITVHYKRKRHTFTIKQLVKIGRQIGQANGTLMEFNFWAYHHETQASLQKLLERVRQS